MKKYIIVFSSAFLAVFGLLTLFMSTSVILDLFGMRAKEGNYVLAVVWANFIASLIYLPSAYGFAKSKKWVTKWLSIAGVLLMLAFIYLWVHINQGGIYETKTVFAMIFRTVITLSLAFLSYHYVSKKEN